MNARPLVLPSALIFLAGAVLVYFALRGWDSKYRLFGGTLAGGSTSDTGDTSINPSSPPTGGGGSIA